MVRDHVPGRHWLVVLACLGIAILPARARERLRGKLLDLTSRATCGPPRALPGSEAPSTPREQALANRVALLEVEKASLGRDLEELFAARDVTTGSDVRLVPAEAFPLAGPADCVRRLVLGRGERDGIQKGAPVLEGSALVGLVGLVTRERSEVRLVTDPTFRLRVTDARAGLDGILQGTGGPLLVFVPAPGAALEPGKELRAGDVLLASRASTLCGLPALVGTIASVERAPGDGFERARVSPATELARIERVVVLKQADPLSVEALAASLPEKKP